MQRLLPLEFASAPRGISGSGCCFGRRARACGSFAGGALFWAFCHILLYYCSDNARSALETGRPATSGNQHARRPARLSAPR